jgi:hypothetical protein
VYEAIIFHRFNDYSWKKMPGNDIDVYLQPLIKYLMELWHEGAEAYDASTKETFKLHAALMWTISD